jgi:tRNA(fMet)-specific endonuclease VapC
VSHLLDTTTCIALFDRRPGPVRERHDEVLLEGGTLFVPSIVLFELSFGVARSTYQFENQRRLKHFLSGSVSVLDFNGNDAESAGILRQTLSARKQPIGPYDTPIAGQALARGLTLVTANVREFSRVEGLKWEDWS